jgi:Putative beta-barrel porin 2
MNKFAASLGLVALGTTALHAVEATALNTMQRSKPWSVAASLRGFYDDNINSSYGNREDSLGFEITPSVDFGLAGDQTSFNLGYQFSARWYDHPQAGNSDHWDLSHVFDGYLAHTFGPRVDMVVRDSFVLGQEPDLLRAGDLPLSTVEFVPGNNIVNYGSIDFNIEATELLGLNIGYANAYYNYAEDGGTMINPSTAALLNRVENRVHLDTLWKVRPETSLILGYEYGQYIYTGDEPIGVGITSDNKDSRSHTMYAGAQHAFTPTLSATVKGGAQYYDYYGDPLGGNEWSPYGVLNLKYQFRSTTSFDAGFSYSRSAADQAGAGTPNAYIRDTEVALLYGSITHEIIAHLVGTARATLQNATYNGGGPNFDGESYLFFGLGCDLAYQFTPNLSAHAGYNYDNNSSDIAGQSYHRNRVYIGLTAGY